MINPEAIENCIKNVRASMRSDNGTYAVYLAGQREGFDMCLEHLPRLTLEKIEQTRKYYMGDTYFASENFRRGITDAYIEVGGMIQADIARAKRASMVSCATRYARIQQGG